MIEGYQKDIDDLGDQIKRLEDELRTVRDLLATQQELNNIYERYGESYAMNTVAASPGDAEKTTGGVSYVSGNELDISPPGWDDWYHQEHLYDLPPALDPPEIIKEPGLVANIEGSCGKGLSAEDDKWGASSS